MARKKKTEPAKPSIPSEETQLDESVKNIPPSQFPIVGIGASAGGLEAFEAFFRAMPHDSGMAFVLVAHLDPSHTSLLPELLQKHTEMTVAQVRDGVEVEPNHVYIIPPNKDLNLFNGSLQLMDLLGPRGTSLPIDSFFRSLAQDQGSNAVCIILSGTGSDGTIGLKAIKGELGMVMVQSVASAQYDGMPRSAIATNLTDYVLAPKEMPQALIGYIQRVRKMPASQRGASIASITPNLQKIYAILRTRTMHDFSQYKENTIERRIERRMHVHQIEDTASYVRYLQESEREVDILFKELLIGVTHFFRDSEAFASLKQLLLKRLEHKPNEYNFRVWVPGCSTGEEAYSLAILLQECMEQLKAYLNIQVFGTDIDEDSIDIARVGSYPASIAADVGEDRLARFFYKEGENYQINKSIRELLVFAPQNLIKDPPFTKLDLLSCRNLLIYFNADLQHKLLPIFHYSLKTDGLLFLGSSETIHQATDLFSTQVKKWKLFERKPATMGSYGTLEFPSRAIEAGEVDNRSVSPTVLRAEELSALQLVEAILRQSDTQPCAIVDSSFNILYIHGRTGRYLEPAIGRTSANILEMARPGLKKELATALRSASVHRQEVLCRDLPVADNGDHLIVSLTVRPILEQTQAHGLLMVVFAEEVSSGEKVESKPQPPAPMQGSKSEENLARELQDVREDLQTTIEELETSNEELKSTNEELQSTNEELQSTNEELETSKEELQSLNEESVTVNVELQSRVDELSQTNDDMRNLLDSTQIATLFLDTELRIRRFTAKMTEIVPLTNADVDRQIAHFASKLIEANLIEHAQTVLDSLVPVEREISSSDGAKFRMRIFPYRTVNNVIAGVVLTFVDVTELKRAEAALRESEVRLTRIFELSGDGVYEIDTAGKIVFANKAYAEMFGYTVGEFTGKQWSEVVHLVALDATDEMYERLLAGETVQGESIGVHKDGRDVHTWFSAGPIFRDDQFVGIIGIIKDITERKRLADAQ